MQNNKKIYCCLAIDKNYIIQAMTTITSVAYNLNKNYKLEVFVFCSDFENKPKEFIKIEELFNIQINCIGCKKYDDYFKSVSMNKCNNFWISIATYYRLLLFKILPEYVDKIIYIDSDMIVDSDLSDIYEQFDSKKMFASVVDVCFMKRFNKYKEKYKPVKEFENLINDFASSPYFCAGFFIANLQMCKKYNVFDQIIKFMIDNPNLILADQDILNAIFSQKYKDFMIYLPLKYDVLIEANPKFLNKNYFYDLKEIKQAYKNPVVYHFAGLFKPWKNYLNFKFTDKWWKYYLMTEDKTLKKPIYRFPIYHLLRKLFP